MPKLKPIAGNDSPRPLKIETDEYRYDPTPRREERIAPSIGIFEAPTRCLIVNKEWWSHVSGMIDTLSTPDMWAGDSDEKTRAIREIADLLASEDCGMSIDYDALKQAIRDGMYEFGNDIAKQIVSGRINNIAVGDDGTVSDPTLGGDSDAGLPEDDPATGIDETEAARYGAMAEIAAKLELVLDKIDGFYGATNGTPTTPEADAQTLMVQYFICDFALMENAVTAYYAYRATNARLLFDVNAAFVQYLYCNGYQNDALNRWLQDVSAFTFAKQQIVAGFWESLGDEFFSHYFAIGAAKPSTVYLDAACVPIAPQTLLNMIFGVARSTTPLKASHRMKFRISGYALDVDGDIQDAFWYRTAAGVTTRTNWTFVHSAGANLPSDNQVVYNDAHIYEYTIDLGALNNVMTITPNKNAGMNAAGLIYPTQFDIQITDLGLAVSQ